MRAEWDTTPAVNTHERLSRKIEKNSIYRAGPGTLSAPDAEALFHDYSSSFPL
jgi:hypothetical protein